MMRITKNKTDLLDLTAFRLFICVCISVKFSFIVSAQNSFVFVGSEVRMPCRTTDPNQAEWKYLAVGSKVLRYVYMNNQLVNEYKSDKRYSVESKDSIKTIYLVILNINYTNAGTYRCSDGSRDNTEFEITVIQSKPACNSNVDLQNVLFDNDCDIKPDYVEINCTVSYRGNIAPVLKWYSSRDVNRWIVHNSKTDQSTICLGFNATKHLEGVVFSFVVEGTNGSELTLPRISALQFPRKYQNSTKISKSDSPSNNMTCLANSSNQVCNYNWTNNGVQVLGDNFISLSDLDPGTYLCVAECSVRNISCRTETVLLEIMNGDTPPFNTQNIWIGLLIAVVILIVFILVILCCKKCFRLNHPEGGHEFEALPERA